jgi:hypothetical protein
MDKAYDYWYSLIGTSPIPETGENVNVAIAFGNGQVVHLEFDERLSRLQGLVSADHRALYSGVLKQVQESLTRGVTADELGISLGPQFRISDPRTLQVEYSDRVIRALRAAYLAPTASPREQIESFLRESLRKLDHYYREVDHAGVQYVRGRYSLADLYEHKLDRYVTVKVPPVRRMIRATHRDVLLNSLTLRKEIPESVIDNHVARASRQFYAFKELGPQIQESAGLEVLRVGIIHPLPANATRAETELANWAAEVWRADAQVLRPRNGDEVKRELKSLIDWSRVA